MATSLADTLSGLRDSSGLDMVGVVSADGLLIESFNDPSIDADAIGAVASGGFMMLDAISRELGQESPKEAILEYEHHLLILTPISEDLVLILLARGEANLGRVRLLLRRSLGSIRTASAEAI